MCWCSLLTLRLRNWGRSSCMCSVTTFIGKLKSSSSPAKHTKLIHAAWRRGAACRRPEHLGCCLKGRYPLLKRCRSLIGWLTFSKGMGHSNVAILVSMCVHVLLVELPRCFAWNCPPARPLPVRWGAGHCGLAAQGHTRGATRLMLVGELPAHVLACCWACSSFRHLSPGVRHLACRFQLFHIRISTELQRCHTHYSLTQKTRHLSTSRS